jgi:hypothetical protein
MIKGLLGFYLGCSFAPNHKGMPVLTAADKIDFLRLFVSYAQALGRLAAVGSELPSPVAASKAVRCRTALTAQNARLQSASGPVPASPASWPPRRASRSPMARRLSADSGTGR